MTGAQANGERPDRRQQHDLRDTVEELLVHVRHLASRARTMSPADLDASQRRLEWLADEVWRAVVEGGDHD